MNHARLLFAALGILALSTVHAGFDPTAVPNTFLADNEQFKGQLPADRRMIDLLLLTGDKAQAAKMIELSWSLITNELAARHRQFADLSLTAVNPWAEESTRAAASAQLESLRPKFEELTELFIPLAASRADLLERAGLSDASKAVSYSKAYHALQLVLERARLTSAGDDMKAGRSDAVAALEKAAAAGDGSLAALAEKTLALSPPPGDMAKLREVALGDPAFAALVASLRDHLAADIVTSALIAGDPASASLWAMRAQQRLAAGRRAASIVDFFVAKALDPKLAGLAPLEQRLRQVPGQPGAIWQEPFFNDDAMALSAARVAAAKSGSAVAQLSAPLERAAGAALRNRNRRLYACSLIEEPPARAAGIAWVLEQHRNEAALIPFTDPQAVQEFSAAIEKAGSNARAVLAAHDTFAPLFASVDGFWKHRVETLAALGQPAGALAALDVAAAVTPGAGWIAGARAKLTAK